MAHAALHVTLRTHHATPAGSLIQGISGVMGVHTVPCDSSDDYNLEIYSEFVKASSARPPMRSIMLRFFARGNELVCVETVQL